MAVTLRMLAQHTGYSIATISRVLNYDPTISVNEETRCIIFDAAQKLGYTGGSGRRTQRMISDVMTIGIAEMLSPAEKMADPYFLYLKNFVDQTCYEKNIQIVGLCEDETGYHALSETEMNGIIAIGFFSDRQIASLERISSNITFLDSSPNELLHDSVVLNFELGIHQALDYLRELGHTRIGFIGPRRLQDDTRHMVIEPRRRYYEHCMRELGLYHREFVLEAPLRDQPAAMDAIKSVYEVIHKEDAPTAILTVNEECAIAAVRALGELNLSIPEDVSIISFNDTVMSTAIHPALTSISPHINYMAKTAVQLVIQRASTPAHPRERIYPQKVVIPPELVKRDSTGVYKSK